MPDTTAPTARPSTASSPVNDPSAGSTFGGGSELTRLRKTLRLNAGFSLLSGLVGIAFAGWVAARLGIGDTGALWVRVIAAGLLGFALVLFGVARTAARHLVPASLEIVVADLTWVAATAVLIALGAFSTGGAVIATVLGSIVLSFAIAQYRNRARAIAAAS